MFRFRSNGDAGESILCGLYSLSLLVGLLCMIGRDGGLGRGSMIRLCDVVDGQLQGMGRRYDEDDRFGDWRFVYKVKELASALTPSVSTLRSAWESGNGEPLS